MRLELRLSKYALFLRIVPKIIFEKLCYTLYKTKVNKKCIFVAFLRLGEYNFCKVLKVIFMNIEKLSAKEIGNNLRHLRTVKKLSVKEVSAALEISPKTYYHYEHGYREPNLALLAKMANFFNCSLDDLVSNSVGGKVDSTISFDSFKIEEGKIKRRSRSKVTTLLDNVIVVHDGLNIMTFLRSDPIVSGEKMLFRYKNKYIIGKIYQNGDVVSFENEGNLVILRKRELEDLLVFGLYHGTLIQDFEIDGFF